MSRLTMGLALAVLAGMGAMGVLAAEKAGADWPQWQGPNRDSVSTETGLLKAWPKEGPPLLWKMEGLGKGLSSLAIVGTTGYTMGDQEDAACVVALDLANPKVLWSTKVGRTWPGGPNGPGTHSTPTVDGDRLYVTTPQGDLAALTTAGKVVWSKNFIKDFGSKNIQWGFSESPLIDGEKLICTPGGKEALLAALDKKTGEAIWKTALEDGVQYGSCIVSEGGGVRQYVANLEKSFVGVEAKTGKVLWRNEKAHKGIGNIPTPVVRGDYVFGANGYGAGAVLLKLSADGAGGVKAEEVKVLEAGQFENHHGGVVLLGDYLYGGSGHMKGLPACIDFKTGAVKWKEDKQPGGGSAAVVAAEGCVYLRYESGEVVLMAASPDGYRELGKFMPPVVNKPAWAHPVILGGRLYLRDQDTLMCYDLKAK
jgi:outer membrane protein assembly factor BamB